MAKSYFFPCPKCQQRLTVETRNAGDRMACPSCGQQIEVPKLRDIVKLQPTDAQESPQSDIVEVNPIKSWLFVIGLTTALGFGAFGWGLKQYSKNLIFEEITTNDIVATEVLVDKTPNELWDVWNSDFANNRQLPEWQQADWRTVSDQGIVLRNVAYGLLGLAALGALALFGSFFVTNKKTHAKKR